MFIKSITKLWLSFFKRYIWLSNTLLVSMPQIFSTERNRCLLNLTSAHQCTMPRVCPVCMWQACFGNLLFICDRIVMVMSFFCDGVPRQCLIYLWQGCHGDSQSVLPRRAGREVSVLHPNQVPHVANAWLPQPAPVQFPGPPVDHGILLSLRLMEWGVGGGAAGRIYWGTRDRGRTVVWCPLER